MQTFRYTAQSTENSDVAWPKRHAHTHWATYYMHTCMKCNCTHSIHIMHIIIIYFVCEQLYYVGRCRAYFGRWFIVCTRICSEYCGLANECSYKSFHQTRPCFHFTCVNLSLVLSYVPAVSSIQTNVNCNHYSCFKLIILSFPVSGILAVSVVCVFE